MDSQAAHRKLANRPGAGLACAGLAGLLLVLLGYAVATQQRGGEAPIARATPAPPGFDHDRLTPASSFPASPAPSALTAADDWPLLVIPPAAPSPTDRPLASPSPAPEGDRATLVVEPVVGQVLSAPGFEAPLPEPAGSPHASSVPAEEAAGDPVFAAPRLGSSGPVMIEMPVPSADAAVDAASLAPIEELLVDSPAPAALNRVLTDRVRGGFALGRSGAVYAARAQFVGVLKKIAEAKDAEEASDRHTAALAAAMRALEEADDFLPQGDALGVELDVSMIAASHRTPLYHQASNGAWVQPTEAIARYHRYAEHKLGQVAAGSEAGSMALYGLGKTHARINETDARPLSSKTSLTMYRAAIAAHQQNYMAANELGVGLAKVGRYEAAERALAHAAAGGGISTVHHNLAAVQRKLGRTRMAAAASGTAERLAASERSAGEFSRQSGVEWVSPDRFARVADASQQSRSPRAAPSPTQPPTAQQPPTGQAMTRRFAPSRVASQPERPTRVASETPAAGTRYRPNLRR